MGERVRSNLPIFGRSPDGPAKLPGRDQKWRRCLRRRPSPRRRCRRSNCESGGVILICGRDETAVEAGNLLKDHLDVTVLIEPPAAIVPPRIADFPMAKGKVRNASGHLGAFEVTVDDFAQPAPSSRGALAFGPSRNNARSSCDIILDLTGGTAFFPAADLRDGYLRADPGNPAAMLQAVLRARDLIGTFEKPHYVAYDALVRPFALADRRLHPLPRSLPGRRSHRPAITWRSTPNLRGLRAMRRGLPDRRGVLRAAAGRCADAQAARDADCLPRSRRGTGGVLVHDEPHGAPLIDALARFGDGLPARVLPFPVNEITQVGLESIAAAFAYGASAMRFLLRARPRHDVRIDADNRAG